MFQTLNAAIYNASASSLLSYRPSSSPPPSPQQPDSLQAYLCNEIFLHRPTRSINTSTPSPSPRQPRHPTGTRPTKVTSIDQHVSRTQATTIICDLGLRNRSTPAAYLIPNRLIDDQQRRSTFYLFFNKCKYILYIKCIHVVYKPNPCYSFPPANKRTP